MFLLLFLLSNKEGDLPTFYINYLYGYIYVLFTCFFFILLDLFLSRVRNNLSDIGFGSQ